MKKSFLLISVFVFGCVLAIISAPKIYIAAFAVGLETWAKILLPTIFPLIFFTKLLTDLGVIDVFASKLSITQKLFKTPPISAYAFLISILSGYPVGAKVVSDLYTDGYITKKDAVKICTFTSNSGPMFIYGSVGISMLFSKTLGLVMLISHILSAICNGMLYRNYKVPGIKQNEIKMQTKPTFSLSAVMIDSITSILLIGGFVSIFFVVIELLNQIHLFAPLAALFQAFGVDPNVVMGIFNGLIEMTHGCLDISTLTLSPAAVAVLCTGIITFGGFATMLQAFAFLQKIGMKFGFFILQKITQTIFACAICLILIFLLNLV